MRDKMENTWVKRNKWIFFVAPLALAAFLAICGAIVMQLWNWLLPALFRWPHIGFWQALGLLVLCRMLFGGFGSHGSDRSKRRRRAEQWEKMTPEERERFRNSWRARCRGFGAAEDESKEPA
jgi:hypothetical protein